MQWEVIGTDRETNQYRVEIIDADSEDSARRRGSRRGLVASEIRPLDMNDSVAGLEPQAMSSTLPRAPMPQHRSPAINASIPTPGQFYQPPVGMPHPGAAFQPVIQVVNNNVIGGGGGQKRWSPAVAALLSFIFPGLGQLYKGQLLNGVAWFFVVCVGYVCLIIPGIVLHLVCIAGAAAGDPYR